MRIAVINAGSWGTAISWLLAGKGYEVKLWTHTPANAVAINETGYNPRYLTDVKLMGVTATPDLTDAVSDVDAIVMVTPSTAVRQTVRNMKDAVAPTTPIIMLSKGLEEGSCCLLTDILEQELGHPERIAALSGPNLSKEISRGIPSATVVASADEECARFFQNVFMTPRFRVYTSDDVCGIEICAAAKNIVAIANGLSVGIGYGDNTTAALITRGLAEMSRLNLALGGNALTCMGLAGMGDLIATCTSEHSRNRTLGTMLAQGKTLDDFTASTHMVAEGAIACRTVTDLADRLGVEMPIALVMRGVLWEGADPRLAADELLTREPKPELQGIE